MSEQDFIVLGQWLDDLPIPEELDLFVRMAARDAPIECPELDGNTAGAVVFEGQLRGSGNTYYAHIVHSGKGKMMFIQVSASRKRIEEKYNELKTRVKKVGATQ